MCLTAENFGLQEKTSTSSTRMDKPQIKKTGWGTTDREKDRWTKRMRKREGGRMQGFVKQEDRSLIDVKKSLA